MTLNFWNILIIARLLWPAYMSGASKPMRRLRWHFVNNRDRITRFIMGRWTGEFSDSAPQRRATIFALSLCVCVCECADKISVLAICRSLFPARDEPSRDRFARAPISIAISVKPVARWHSSTQHKQIISRRIPRLFMYEEYVRSLLHYIIRTALRIAKRRVQGQKLDILRRKENCKLC